MPDYFTMGNALGSAYSDGQEEKRQRDRQIEADSRAKKQFDDQQAEGLYQRTERSNADAAIANYTAGQNGGAAPGAGLSRESAGVVQKSYAGDTGMRALQTAGGDSAREGARMGIPQEAQAQRAPATPRQLNALLGQVYGAQKNVKGMAESAAQDRVLHRGEITVSAGKAFDSMAPDDQAKWAGGLTTGRNGHIAVSTKDANGYWTVTLGKPGDKDRQGLALNDAEARQMYIASQMMSEGHGEEAQAMMLAGGEKLRAIAVEYSKSVTEQAKNNNNATKDRIAGVNAATTAGAAVTSARAAVTSAGAAVTRANTDSRQADAVIGEITAKRADTIEAKKIAVEFNALSPEDQVGVKGLAIKNRYNIATAGPGAQLSTTPPRGGGAAAAASIRYEANNAWSDIEKKLRSDNISQKEIEAQREGFLKMRGVAPQATINALMSGRDSTRGGVAMTADDVAQFNAKYPGTPVDPATLPWLSPATAPKKETGATGGIPAPNSRVAGSTMVNPYVDPKGNHKRGAPEGAGPAIVPLVRDAVRGINAAGESGMMRYIQSKVDRGEPLSPAEEMRAGQFGITRGGT